MREAKTVSAWLRTSVMAAAALSAGHAFGANCESLASLSLPNTTITTAQSIPAGTYQPPGSPRAFSGLPAFCRITATVRPVPGSEIGIEVWLPSTTWNGKYQQEGSHGLGGVFFWGEMVLQIQRGYATGITNDGHGGPGGFDTSWAFGNPEKVTDFAWRAVHELAEKAKLLIAAHYGRPARYSYFNGCSNGGRQGMKAAQMFPHDFDGIIAGGAASWLTRAATEQFVMSVNLQQAGIQGASGASVLNLAQSAATAACDAGDGVADGIINDPRRCHWDPNTLVCKAGQDPSTCFTPAQAAAIKSNVEPVRDPATGRWIFSGMSRGSEFDQIRFGYNLGLAPFGVAVYRIGLNDPAWNGSTFGLHRDFPIVDRALDSMNALDADLKKFRKAGGKLIQWHGWADAAFTPGGTVRYYQDVVEKTGHGELEDVQDFYRLFMLPSVGHCGTGPGPDNIGAENQASVSRDPEHDIVSALEAWVERGVAPRRLIATKFNNNSPAQGIQLQRPTCPYPQEAVYNGFGDPAQASSFDCRRPFNHGHGDHDD